MKKVTFLAEETVNAVNEHLLSFALLALFLGAGHEDHVVDLAKGPDQVGDFLLRRILWDACQVNQALCERAALGGQSQDFLLLLGRRWLHSLEINSLKLVFHKNKATFYHFDQELNCEFMPK